MKLIILTEFLSFTVNEDKLQNQSIWRFLLRSGYGILVKIWKWLKLLNSVPFIKKTLVRYVYIRILSSWLTFHSFKVNEEKLENYSTFKIPAKVQVYDSGQIWKWLKLLNSVPFIKKTLVNHVYIWIWSYWLTFTVLQWMKTNFKISQFSRFLLMSEYTIQVKIGKGIKLLNSVPFIKKTLVNQVYMRIWSSRLTFTVLQWMKRNSKIYSIFKLSANVQLCDLAQNLIMTKTSYFFSIHQENTFKSIFSFEFDRFEWLSQLYSEQRQSSRKSIWKFLLRSGGCDLGQNLKMTKTS